MKNNLIVAFVSITSLFVIFLTSNSCLGVETDTQEFWLSNLDYSRIEQGWGQGRSNRSVDNRRMTVAGKRYNNGIGTHAYSIIPLKISGKANELSGLVGLDDETGNRGSVVFHVSADGKELWNSGLMKPGDSAREFSVGLKGAELLVLEVQDGGDGYDYDHADWLIMKITMIDDAKPILDIPPIEEPYILTPKPGPEPRITGAKVFGVRPNSPFLFKATATGDRPMIFSADGLPSGLKLNPVTGRITGIINKKGEYKVALNAKNSVGQATRDFKIVCGDTIGLTPSLGWNSWNCFAGAVTAEKIKAAAEAMVSSGLVDHGWTYINIDDFWMVHRDSSDPTLQGPRRNEDGVILPNPRFSDMGGLADYVHDLGLKIGIYSSPGPWSCGGCVGSFNFELQDAEQYAQWGIDYLKYDWCSYNKGLEQHRGNTSWDPSQARNITYAGGNYTLEDHKHPFKIMQEALSKQPRDIIYSLCQYGMANVWEWGESVGGNSWRTTNDINDSWGSMSGIGFAQNGHEKYAGPGHFNDPDMLVVGKVGWGPQLRDSRLSPNEQYTHISLWCLLSSPLLIGCDMTLMDEFTLNLLTNDEVLEVNQDPLGCQASRISVNGKLEVWAKDMEDGSKAVGLFNRGSMEDAVNINWSELGISGEQTVRDLWRQKDIGKFRGKFQAKVGRHGVVLVKISPVKVDTATNPVIWADVPDVAAIRVGDTYYMSSTTMHMNPGLPIMKSKDLVNWELLGYAYDKLVDNDAMNLENGRNAYGSGSWASSLRYHNGTYYVSTFSSTSGKTHIYHTKDIEKCVWEKISFSPSLHDHSLYFDDDGRVYMIYGVDDLRLVELNSDLSGIKQGGFNEVVIHNASAVAGDNIMLKAEGSQIRKINGKYYVMNITWPRGSMRTQIIHRADKITGPYESKLILQDKGVAQGCLIDTPNGKWYAFLFQDNGAVGRSPFLVPVKWEDGWPVLGNDGKVPLNLDIHVKNICLADTNIVASDEFNRKQDEPMPLAWQWNHNPVDNDWSLGQRKGYLRITTGRVDTDVLQARNMLTQRTFGPECSATTKLDVSKMKDGDRAGLIALQRRYGFVGVKQEGDSKTIIMISAQSNRPEEVESIPLDQNTIHFRIDCDFRNRADKANFFFSFDGRNWKKIGSELKMAYTLPHFMGYRFGLVNYATKTAGGYVDFDYYHITGEKTQSKIESKLFQYEGNPIFRDVFTADPAPLVVGDTMYVYAGHDEAHGKQMFNITEWLCYSTKDMETWTAHGPIMKPTDFKWAVGDAWASQVVEKDGKFYFYTTVQHGEPHVGKAIGVAVSDSPTGPFRDARGTALVTDNTTPSDKPWNDIDPTVFIDDDGAAYMAWGNPYLYIVKLKPNMIELDGEIEEIKLPNYTEGPWLHKRGHIYYLTYAAFAHQGKWEKICYATAPSIKGPWTYQGILTDQTKTSYTIHPGIVEFKGNWYLFYHTADLSIDGEKGGLGRRCVCVENLYYNEDGTMKPVTQTVKGINDR